MNTSEHFQQRLYKVNHDLKNPLSGIKLTIDLLLDEKIGSLTETQRTLLRNSQKDCHQMEQMLNELITDE